MGHVEIQQQIMLPHGPRTYRRVVPVYMCGEPILCAGCRCLITPLSGFTRSRRAGETQPHAICWTCRPFRVPPDPRQEGGAA